MSQIEHPTSEELEDTKKPDLFKEGNLFNFDQSSENPEDDEEFTFCATEGPTCESCSG